MGEQDGGKFPEVQGGGSLILAWQIKGKKVLVIGGGEVSPRSSPRHAPLPRQLHLSILSAGRPSDHAFQVAAGRILNCLNADASVTVISPAAGLNPEVAHRVRLGQVAHVDRAFQASDLDDPTISMVLAAIDDPAVSTEIYMLCRERRIPANIADVPPECDFYFGSVHRDGPLQVMVSTNGKGPRLASTIRKQVAASLPGNAGAAIERVGRLRGMLRKVEPGSDAVARRMGWMIRVSDAYSWESFCDLTEEDMENLLLFYPKEVPELDVLKAMREEPDYVFDGSFGFSVGC